MSFTTHMIVLYGMLVPVILGAGCLTVALISEVQNLKTVKVED